MMMSKEVKVIRAREAKSFMEGDEYCKLYLDYDKIMFGLSILHPGHKGSVDPGHENAFELFFVVKGKVVCHIPDENIYEELNENDAILIPPKKAHQLINVGDTVAVITWSQAKF